MEQGIIIKSTGSWYTLEGLDGRVYKGRTKGKLKLKIVNVTNPIAVGDKVLFEKENEIENTVVITDVLPRINYFIRQSVHKASTGHLIASNIDQSVLVVTLAMPKTSLGFMDRFLVTNESFRIPAVLVFNKSDLYDNSIQTDLKKLIEVYEALGYSCLISSTKTGEGMEELRKILSHKTSLISGHSGVGKSSIINTLIPGLALATTEISSFANKGVHTTTYAEMYKVDRDSSIIDTPGIKELGIFEIPGEELSHYFPEMRALLNQCKFHNCQHVNEPACAVVEKVKNGGIALSRYESYLSILSGEDNRK
jgi:ribosome biogenesis GTPase